MSGSDSVKKNTAWLKLALGVAGLIALFAVYQFLPLSEWIESFQGWVKELGSLGWFIFIGVYALATAILAPGAFLTIAAGVAYGLGGFFIVIVGATLGAALAFLAARYLLQKKVQHTIEERPKMKAVNLAIKDEGWKVVALMRLSPAIPFNLQNWFFGATSIGFWPYILATFFGIMPGTLLYIWIGSIGGMAATDGETSTVKYAFFAIGIIATLVVTYIIGRKASAKLKEHGVKDNNSDE